MIQNIKSILNDTMRVRFEYFRDGCLWYSTLNGFYFPVDVSNTHSTTVFKGTDYAKNFEYYIKKEWNKKNNFDNK